MERSGADDLYLRAVAYDGQVRVFFARTTRSVEEIVRMQETSMTGAAALGRTGTMAAIMGKMLKGEKSVTIYVRGNGPIGTIIALADGEGHFRVTAQHPEIELPLGAHGKLDVAGLVGRRGMIEVVKDLGLKEPYRGVSPIISGELAEDFTYYFAHSEQTPSAVGLGVLVRPDLTIEAAGGFLVQPLPDAGETVISSLEKHIEKMGALTTLLQEESDAERILRRIIGSDIEVLERAPLAFRCDCSYERSLGSLAVLTVEELQAYIDQDERPEVRCAFCKRRYLIELSDVEALIKRAHI
ncbi:MAG: Chaperonin (heat shock protein 33) [Candidatus Carbobacillus altaicus]|uniref:33 kDa chaperonin n=1 Tax=Candidatus Carbonibacillus altaicus TaxID=2163959 RepID=A0A2R6Y1L1_9BACL|nr:MAG: Chaperonin (heat shock protein 33) [Candidatus Carbobacillus altaicus]